MINLPKWPISFLGEQNLHLESGGPGAFCSTSAPFKKQLFLTSVTPAAQIRGMGAATSFGQGRPSAAFSQPRASPRPPRLPPGASVLCRVLRLAPRGASSGDSLGTGGGTSRWPGEPREPRWDLLTLAEAASSPPPSQVSGVPSSLLPWAGQLDGHQRLIPSHSSVGALVNSLNLFATTRYLAFSPCPPLPC